MEVVSFELRVRVLPFLGKASKYEEEEEVKEGGMKVQPRSVGRWRFVVLASGGLGLAWFGGAAAALAAAIRGLEEELFLPPRRSSHRALTSSSYSSKKALFPFFPPPPSTPQRQLSRFLFTHIENDAGRYIYLLFRKAKIVQKTQNAM